MYVYLVLEYDERGKYKMHKYSALFDTLEGARETIRILLRLRELEENRKWYPSDEGVVEAYYMYPPGHPSFDGCGGYVIFKIKKS